jgi:hypothetical protein
MLKTKAATEAERIAIYASGDLPTYRSCVELCRFVSGAGSRMALAGFITVRTPRRSEFTAGDAGCHPGNGLVNNRG